MNAKKYKKAYVIIDVIISVICIISLSLPIIKTVNAMNKDKALYKDTKKIIDIMDEIKEYIQQNSANYEINETMIFNEYSGKISTYKKIDENLYKYRVVISDKNEIKAQYDIIKLYN